MVTDMETPGRTEVTSTVTVGESRGFRPYENLVDVMTTLIG